MSRLSSARPASARSRSAWDDGADGGYDNQGMQMRSDSRASMGDDMGQMDSDLYDPSVRVDQQPVVQVQEPPSGCFHKFKKGVRCKFLEFFSSPIFLNNSACTLVNEVKEGVAIKIVLSA